MTKTPTNWTGRDDAMVEHMIRRGASRRDLLKMLMSSGVAAAAGGSLLMRASAAVAATPVTGGTLRAAGWSSSTADTLDPAKASLSTDYARCCAFYNRLTFLDEEGQVNMNEVVLDAVKNLHLDIQENRAQVNLVRYLPILDGHHGQLVQLVQNVISNSIKYKAPDRHPVVLIDGKEEAEDCVFSITDNGIGIPADQLKRVFQRNVRLHDDQAVEGSGLGLASCKQIVDRMGGEIWIESKVGTGSTLCFRLPKQRKNERPAEAVTPQTREEQNTLRRLRAKSRAAIF